VRPEQLFAEYRHQFLARLGPGWRGAEKNGV